MNFTPLIFDQAKKYEGFVEFILVAGAPISVKNVKGIEKISERKLTPEDVHETLASLRTHVAGRIRLEPNRGVFSFGIPEVGRFRVVYFLQRGSLVVSVAKTSFEPLNLEDILENKEAYKKASEIILEKNIICVLSPSKIAYGEFMLSFLNKIGEEKSLLIYTAERPLTYLLKHKNSLFIQREIGMDIDNLREALRDSLSIYPNILFVNDMFLSGGETLKDVFEFFPYPFSVVFGLIGEKREDFEKTLKNFNMEYVKDAVNFLWILKYREGKYHLEIIT